MRTEAGAWVTGEVTLTERRSGRIVRELRQHNAFTLLGAADIARLMAGGSASLVPVSVGLGMDAGTTIDQCESATGWSDSPVADGVVFRQGHASLSRSVSALGTAAPYNAATAAPFSAAGDISLWMRIDFRGRCDLATSAVRIYTGGVSANWFTASLAAVEAAMGAPFTDGTWALATVPRASFSVGGGTPSWSAVTGLGIVVAANAVGALKIWWDDARATAPADVSSAATAVPDQRTVAPVLDIALSGGTATATAVWGVDDAVGQWLTAGLYTNGGSTLAAIVALSYYKPQGSTLTVNWALAPQGG